MSQEIIKKTNDNGGSYHKLEFPDGTVLNGIFDMSKYLKYYGIPDLKGKDVLDVGTGTGYFAFEFFKMNANKVVAVSDLISPIHEASNELMGADVKFIQKDLYDLDESFGKFDLVFCSHVFQHIPDIFSAIKKLYSVTKEQAIFSTNILQDPKYSELAVAFFAGMQTEYRGKYHPTYWLPNIECLARMMRFAGFKNVKVHSRYDLRGENEKNVNKIPSVVMHGFV